MNKLLIVLFAFVVLPSCNTAKHLEKQQAAIESLTNKVTASKVLQIKDSIVYKEGQTLVKSDTAVIWNNVGDTIYKEFHYRNDYYRNDTIKIFQRDAVRENALFSENEKNKALANASQNQISYLKQLIKTYLIVCGAIFLIALVLTKIKFL